MTWIKPSLAWMLYRAGYGEKHNQTSILKIKLGHTAMAKLLGECVCKHGGGGGLGRVQWDPARDLLKSEKKGQKVLPRKMARSRVIQIGLKGHLSELYVSSILSIEDVTPLAKLIKEAHSMKTEDDVNMKMAEIQKMLPGERKYIPYLEEEKLDQIEL